MKDIRRVHDKATYQAASRPRNVDPRRQLHDVRLVGDPQANVAPRNGEVTQPAHMKMSQSAVGMRKGDLLGLKARESSIPVKDLCGQLKIRCTDVRRGKDGSPDLEHQRCGRGASGDKQRQTQQGGDAPVVIGWTANSPQRPWQDGRATTTVWSQRASRCALTCPRVSDTTLLKDTTT